MYSNKLYTPLRYPGGKARFAPLIAELMHTNGLAGGHYLEPYAGGAGVALTLLLDGVVEHIHINDADPAVAVFWRTVTQQTRELSDMVANEPVTMDAWHHWRAVMLGQVPATELDRGFATLFMNRTNRSGILKGDDDEDEGAVERTSKPKSVWIGGEFSTDSAKRALKALLPGEVFDFPKSIDFLRTCILLGTSGTDIVLDLFSGSGATAQAVTQQNALDGQSRRFVCVQLPEPLDPSEKSQKAGAALCDKLGVPRNIAELTKERIRRAGARVKADNPMFAGNTGFRVFKLDHSNIRAWNPNPADLEQTLFAHQDHLIEGRTESDVLYELLLKLGLDLCVPIEQRTINGKDVHSVGGGVLMACLSSLISRDDVEPIAQGIIAWHKELASAGDTTCVFRDSAFADDVAKTNLAAILEQHGIQNVRSL